MAFPQQRLRRLRRTPALRAMVRETKVTPDDLIMPLFVVPGSAVKKEITAMPGQHQFSVELCAAEAKRLFDLGVPAVLLFAIPEYKDERGSAAWAKDGVVPRAIEAVKKAAPGLMVITDLCFCEYTSHGHCGIMKDGELDNDASLQILVKQALVHARAGADIVAPSGMLDGMVGALREGLDEHHLEQVVIMSYAAKYASGFYGPFREAVESAPQYGDRRGYQMDSGNVQEALREVALDVAEGADILMVKPALSFLDVIWRVKERFQLPLASYNVSGEYAMIKAAAAQGWIDGERIMLEVLQSIKRAGADLIISYFAADFAEMYRQGRTG